MTSADAAFAGRPYKGRSNQKPQIYRIDGENVTMEQIAKRLGLTTGGARARMGSLRGASGAITWARLEAIGK